MRASRRSPARLPSWLERAAAIRLAARRKLGAAARAAPRPGPRPCARPGGGPSGCLGAGPWAAARLTKPASCVIHLEQAGTGDQETGAEQAEDQQDQGDRGRPVEVAVLERVHVGKLVG